ncbi:MAG TPA: thioredoxin, partial [Patescibacteria group bacterium]|nr:thioredoxin [Patescibacteria group bacterium]
MARAAEVDVAGWAEAVEAYFERGWSDGLPVVPATPESIQPFLAAVGLQPADIVLTEATRRRSISAEKIAINAVMAGCRPEYMPVLLAALEAMADPAFTLHG